MSLTAAKRVYDPPTFFRLLEDMLSHLGDMRTAMKGDRVDNAFSERIMLAVTQVNGCQYCSYFHSKNALEAGMSASEIQELLRGEMGAVPVDESVALVFAQHYAESVANPDPDVYHRLLDTYGPETTRDIMANIRAIMIGNIYGNNFDALLHRLKWKPFPNSRLWRELVIVVGSIFVFPVVAVRSWFRSR